MKQNSSIYFLSLFSVFNRESVPKFESFNEEDSSYLFSTLLLNNKELKEKSNSVLNALFVLNKNDEEYLTEHPCGLENIIFINTGDTSLMRNLSEKYFYKFANNLIIFTNSIGITPEDINQTFNLLSMEDEAIVLGKTINQSLAFIGFNSLNSNLFDGIDLANLNFDSFLGRISEFRNFVHVLDNFMLIKDINDFKNLYHQLSKKESFAYCGQEIHERFTNLFIEYKDLLK